MDKAIILLLMVSFSSCTPLDRPVLTELTNQAQRLGCLKIVHMAMNEEKIFSYEGRDLILKCRVISSVSAESLYLKKLNQIGGKTE